MTNNYTQQDYLDCEEELNNKIFEYTELPKIQSQLSEAYYIWLNNPGIITDHIDEEDLDDETFTKFFDWFIFDFKLMDIRQTVVEDFLYHENLSDLEVIIIKDWISSYCSFFEITRIEKDRGCKIKDILSERNFEIIDKNASKKLTVSDLIFARPIKTGENHYFSGVISVFPKILRKNIIDNFSTEFDNYKKQYGSSVKVENFLKDWSYALYKNMEDFLNNPQFINKEGEEFVVAKSFFEIIDKEMFIDELRKLSDFDELSDSNSEINLFLSSDKNSSSYLEIENQKLTIESGSVKNLKKLKRDIEKRFNKKVRYQSDLIKNVDSYVSSGKSTELDEHSKKSFDIYYDKWINNPLEKLDGKSPLEAFKDKKYKIILDEILKDLEFLYIDAKKNGEPYYDVSEIRKKLSENNIT